MQGEIAFSYAPGKIILVGEHAVVYGASAIAMPIDSGVRVAVMRSSSLNGQGPQLRGLGPFLMGEIKAGDDKNIGMPVLQEALAYLLQSFKDEAKEMSIVVDGSLPPGSGLGSSASLSVALIKGIYRYLNQDLPTSVLKEHVQALEKLFHGRPSGIDQTVIIEEKPLLFKKLEEGISARPLELKNNLSFVIGLAGPHKGTLNVIKEVAARSKRQERAFNAIFRELDLVALDMAQAFSSEALASVGELMNIAQGFLNALGLSTPKIEKLCAIARDRGALGAKLTGAGQGGAVIVLCDGNQEEIKNAFCAAGYQSFIANVHRSRDDK